MASNDDDYGLKAYQDIQAQLGLWGEPSPSPRRKSPSASRYNDSVNTPAAFGASDGQEADNFMDDDEDAIGRSPNLRSPEEEVVNNHQEGPVGVQTPLPAEHDDEAMEHENYYDGDDDGDRNTAHVIIGDDSDSYGPYHNALLTFLQSRERLSKAYSAVQVEDGDDDDAMQEDNEELAEANAAGEEAEMKFLSSLAEICLLRGSQDGRNGGRSATASAAGLCEASKNEGNFWDLMTALREGGTDSLFYCVNGESPPDLLLNKDPATMVATSPAEVLEACLGEDENGNTSLPLQRLNAALSWIEACLGRNFDEKIANEYKNSSDPILPPPGRRTMWPATVESMKRKGGKIHLDAPLQHMFGDRSTSPASVSSFLESEDEANEARLLRACFMLFQAGRVEEALKLVSDCGQPWRAASWIGGEPLSSDGSGNPTRAFWKKQCRQISKQMARVTQVGNSPQESTRSLHSSIAYEAAILCLLSDDVNNALKNPVFQTWESGVHAVLHAERGIIVDEVLMAHNNARIEAAEESQTHFPYVGTEFDALDATETAPEGCDGDLGAALEQLDSSLLDEVREGSGDPFRNGMSSFLVGQNAVKEYIEECAALSIAAQNEDEACFLRFIVHLVIYIDSVLPDFSSQLSLPQDVSAGGDSNDDSLCELLLLKYISYLSTRRDLWPHVALYCSLLSVDNILETYSSFLINVHSDQERKMALQQARDFFPEGLDCCILRNVVREMIISDIPWHHAPGEEGTPAGVNSADARKMRSIHWLCYYPEHWPDALVCSNQLLRIFLLTEGVGTEPSDSNLLACKIFCDKMLPDDLADVAVMQCEQNDGHVPSSISLPMAQNLRKEYISIERFLNAHTMYAQFLDVLANTSPTHSSKSKMAGGTQNEFEKGIADKMERNAFRQKKTGVCKIITKAASRASDALMEVISFSGGWLIDENVFLNEEDTEEAQSRSHEMSAIRSLFLPKMVFMLYEVLDKTASWLEQVVYDTLIQFGSGSEDILLSLFSTFDESDRSNNDEVTVDVLTTSLAAPGYWHSKALSLASVIGNDANNQVLGSDMELFQTSIAESHMKLGRCSKFDSLFDC